MACHSVINPKSLSMLSRVLESHCARHGIRSVEARESVAVSLLGFYGAGVGCEEQLASRLAQQDDPETHHKRAREALLGQTSRHVTSIAARRSDAL